MSFLLAREKRIEEIKEKLQGSLDFSFMRKSGTRKITFETDSKYERSLDHKWQKFIHLLELVIIRS